MPQGFLVQPQHLLMVSEIGRRHFPESITLQAAKTNSSSSSLLLRIFSAVGTQRANALPPPTDVGCRSRYLLHLIKNNNRGVYILLGAFIPLKYRNNNWNSFLSDFCLKIFTLSWLLVLLSFLTKFLLSAWYPHIQIKCAPPFQTWSSYIYLLHVFLSYIMYRSVLYALISIKIWLFLHLFLPAVLISPTLFGIL